MSEWFIGVDIMEGRDWVGWCGRSRICLSTFTVHFSMAGMVGVGISQSRRSNGGPPGPGVQEPFRVAQCPTMMTGLTVVLGKGNSLLGPADCGRDSSEMNNYSSNGESLIWDMM